jgi:hypothetical protein
MATPLESLHAKLRSEAPVAKTDVEAARAEYGAMDDAAKAAQRDMLLDLRYRANTGKVADEAKAELGLLQNDLPARDTLETARHAVLDGADIAKDFGQKGLDAASETFERGAKGVGDIGAALAEGDVRGALTHPVAATVLGVLGFTALSNVVLGTRTSWLKTLLAVSGVTLLANIVQKYAK